MQTVASYTFDYQAAEAAVLLSAQTGVPHFVSAGEGGSVVVVRLDQASGADLLDAEQREYLREKVMAHA